jgi:hypothetical protein
MPTIKVRDLAWVRLRAPDLDAQEEFLTHFGLTRAARTPTALYMRGTDPAHHIHVTEKAKDAGFVGFAYHAAAEGDLARVAATPGASAVEASTSRAAASACASRSRTATRSKWCGTSRRCR